MDLFIKENPPEGWRMRHWTRPSRPLPNRRPDEGSYGGIKVFGGMMEK